jgi:hypothetical protein
LKQARIKIFTWKLNKINFKKNGKSFSLTWYQSSFILVKQTKQVMRWNKYLK